MMTHPVSTTCLLPGPVGPLECLLTPSEAANAAMAIICHPHPQQQGTMHHKVVFMMHKAYLSLGLATLRFNYRGVGESRGSYGAGVGELADLQALIDYCHRAGYTQIHLAGFSFGAFIALSAAALNSIESLSLAAPPIHYAGFKDLSTTAPTLVLAASADELVDYAQLVAWAHQAPFIRRLETLAGGHFFHGKLPEFKTALIEFVDALQRQ